MHCTLPLPKLLLSPITANRRNTKSFLHSELKFSLLSHKSVLAGWGYCLQLHLGFKFEHTICALATAEGKPLAPISSSESQNGAYSNYRALQEVSQDSDVDEKEKLRRLKISKANKGKVPWNKGKKHTPETLQLIRERTKLAMQDPKIKMKLSEYTGRAHSEETKSKIGNKVKESWRRRHPTKVIQDGVKDSNVTKSQDAVQKDLNQHLTKIIQDRVKALNVGESQDVSENDLTGDEKEKLRRLRISRAIKGRVPWNKGKKHSPETLERIRERTKIAMRSPKMQEAWMRQRKKKIIQQQCLVEWNNAVAEAARVGLHGDEELQWDMHEILLQKEL